MSSTQVNNIPPPPPPDPQRWWSASSISKIQVPRGFSPQNCTDRNGQSLNPPGFISLGRSWSNLERVPLGDVRWMTA